MKLKIKPDREKARGIKNITQSRKNFIKYCKGKIFPTIICENYYEILKELATAIFLSEGIKFVGEYAHKEIFEELSKLMGLEQFEFYLLDDLRIRRNGSLYYGEPFEEIYLKNNEEKIELLMKKIESFLNKELEEK